jgi:glucosamine kinase
MTYRGNVRAVSGQHSYLIGIDAGGTSTRCLVVDEAGRRVGESRAGGLNQHSSGADVAGILQRVIGGALGGLSPRAVSGGVLGVAGAGGAGVAKVQRDAESVWRAVGLGGSPVVVPDVVATFAAGSTHRSGVSLVAGTGAIAAVVEDTTVVRQADGYGWLLGDVGSAVWLGREAAVAALEQLDGRLGATALTGEVLAALDVSDAQGVVRAVYAAPPAQLGLLAPVVTGRAEAGDPVAADIVGRGVAGLLRSYDAVSGGTSALPTVLGGALLVEDGPVRRAVERGLRTRGVTDLCSTSTPVEGAARLALRLLGGPRPASTGQ